MKISEKLLTIPEVAQRLSVSRRTVYYYIKYGVLSHTCLPSGRMRISDKELKFFITICHRRGENPGSPG